MNPCNGALWSTLATCTRVHGHKRGVSARSLGSRRTGEGRRDMRVKPLLKLYVKRRMMMMMSCEPARKEGSPAGFAHEARSA